MRVDAHAHVTREGWIGDRWWDAYAEEAGRRVGLPARVVREVAVPAMFEDDAGSLQLGSMQEAGIEVAVVYNFDWTLAEALGPARVDWREQNDWYARFAERNPGRIRWGFGADPRHEGALDAFREAVAARGAVCLKLHPSSGFLLNDPVIHPFVETAQHDDVPVVFHVGPEPPPLESRWSDPELLADVARRFPDARFLAGHCGNEAWRETVAAVRDLGSVSVDISGWQVRFVQDAGRFYGDVREVIDALGMERVMWGSDPPYYRALVPDTQWLAAFTEAPEGTFSADEVEAITGANAASFFRL